MYPDWPQSDADLVPLPQCDGPKLDPFKFSGAQAIEFLEHIGEGLHAHVFKVSIHNQIYALKLVSRQHRHDTNEKECCLTLLYSSASSMIAVGVALQKMQTRKTANC